jgi:hypothetical protein
MKRILTLAVTFTLFSFSMNAQNLLVTLDGNPGFEGFDGASNVYWWRLQVGAGAGTRTATSEVTPHGGSLCAKVVITAVPMNDYDIQLINDKGPFPLVMGTSYTLRYWARGAAGGETINTAVQQDASGSYQGHYSGTGALNTTWTQYTQTFNAAANANYGLKFTLGTGLGTVYIDDVEFGTTATIVPVELVGFQAKGKNQSVALNWQVAQELRLKDYTVQRSADGQKFEDIGSIVAQNGPLSKNYAFEDQKPSKGLNYYRLKINEEDGTFKYSKVQSAVIGGKGEVSVSPNPTTGLIQLKNADSLESLEVYDLSGRLVRQFSNNNTQLDISDLAKGIYQLTIKANGTVSFAKVVKM